MLLSIRTNESLSNDFKALCTSLSDTFSSSEIKATKSESEVVAISLVCTHLGCTVNRIETGFLCPCHGSQYDSDGNVVGGPAPKTLPWLAIKKVPGNQIEVNTGEFVPENTYFKFI